MGLAVSRHIPVRPDRLAGRREDAIGPERAMFESNFPVDKGSVG